MITSSSRPQWSTDGNQVWLHSWRVPLYRGMCATTPIRGPRKGPRAEPHNPPISDRFIGWVRHLCRFSGGCCEGFSGRIGAGRWRVGAGAAN
jgi:hypothetical protein